MVRSLPACRVHRAERELSPHAVLCASFPRTPERWHFTPKSSRESMPGVAKVCAPKQAREAGLPTQRRAGKLVCMPELPDITAYITALEPRVIGQRLERVRLGSPFLLRTAQPPLASVE